MRWQPRRRHKLHSKLAQLAGLALVHLLGLEAVLVLGRLAGLEVSAAWAGLL
jgi:hypothetical protein